MAVVEWVDSFFKKICLYLNWECGGFSLTE
jgi:hypothetical protein